MRRRVNNVLTSKKVPPETNETIKKLGVAFYML